MKFNPEMHHRRTIRLHGYDYAKAGIYFITICTHERQALFGMVNEGEMALNRFGEIVAQTWMALADQFGYISLGEFVVMPNHFHGLLMMDVETNPDDTPDNRKSVGRILGRFKMVSAKRINLLRGMAGVVVWQRNYYEHIVRDEASLLKIVEYIQTNPQKWQEDRYHTV